MGFNLQGWPPADACSWPWAACSDLLHEQLLSQLPSN